MKTTSCRNLGKSSFSQLLKSCMDSEILVNVCVQDWQEKWKGTDCCLVKLCSAACVWIAWAKEGNQRVLVLHKVVNSLQHQMGLNSAHEVVRRFQHCSSQEKWNPFNWLVTASGHLWFCFLYYFAVSEQNCPSPSHLHFLHDHTLKPSSPIHKTPMSSSCRRNGDMKTIAAAQLFLPDTSYPWHPSVLGVKLSFPGFSYQDQSFRKWNQV